MGVTSKNKSAASEHTAVLTPRKHTTCHTIPKPLDISLDQPGRIRVANFQWLLGGISASAFYDRLKKGRVPPPCGNDGRPYWRTEIVKNYLEK